MLHLPFASLFSLILVGIALILAIPVTVLLIECLVAVFLSQDDLDETRTALPNLAVLVPAHNEATGIRPVLEALLGQLSAQDRVIVIADNCDDDTAAIARSTGVTVIERNDPAHRGKGYALDYGVKFLSNDPPEVVVMVDADCLVQKGSIDRLVRQTLRTQQPVQGTYLMERPVPPKPKDAVSALAFMVKNLVRPQGLAQLGLPCLLTGTGMAFPWSVLSQISLASSNLVEDMQMAIDLAIAGHSASFCASACVMGMLPQQDQAAKTQRTRWEHGHLQTLLTQVPKLVKAAVQQKRFDLLSMALDLSVPPVSLLVMLWLAATASAVLAMLLGGSWVPVTLLITEGFMLLVAVLAAWAKFGRADLPARTLLAVPFYVLWKLPLYITFITQPQRKWVRTARDASTSEHPQ